MKLFALVTSLALLAVPAGAAFAAPAKVAKSKARGSKKGPKLRQPSPRAAKLMRKGIKRLQQTGPMRAAKGMPTPPQNPGAPVPADETPKVSLEAFKTAEVSYRKTQSPVVFIGAFRAWFAGADSIGLVPGWTLNHELARFDLIFAGAWANGRDILVDCEGKFAGPVRIEMWETRRGGSSRGDTFEVLPSSNDTHLKFILSPPDKPSNHNPAIMIPGEGKMITVSGCRVERL